MDCIIPDVSPISTLENKSLLKKSRCEGGAFLLPPFSHLRLSGDDSFRYLNGQITADLSKLSPGDSLPACLLTPKGRLVAFLNIFKQDESFLIEMDSSLQEVVLERLELYLVADNVSIEVVTPPKTIHIFGPLAKHPEIQNIPGTLISRIGFPGKDLTRIFHTDLLRKPGSQMDAALDSHFDLDSMYTYSPTSKCSPALPHQPSRPPRYDQYEICGLRKSESFLTIRL